MLSTAPSTLSARAQAIVPALLVLLAVVAISPLADVLVPNFPPRTGELQWRFRAFGMYLAAMPQMALILAVIIGVGLHTAHRGAVRAASILALLLAVIALPLLAFFALDFIQMRRIVPLDSRRTFDLAAMKTGFFAGLFGLVLIWVGFRAFQASVLEKSERRSKGQGLVVGQE